MIYDNNMLLELKTFDELYTKQSFIDDVMTNSVLYGLDSNVIGNNELDTFYNVMVMYFKGQRTLYNTKELFTDDFMRIWASNYYHIVKQYELLNLDYDFTSGIVETLDRDVTGGDNLNKQIDRTMTNNDSENTKRLEDNTLTENITYTRTEDNTLTDGESIDEIMYDKPQFNDIEKNVSGKNNTIRDNTIGDLKDISETNLNVKGDLKDIDNTITSSKEMIDDLAEIQTKTNNQNEIYIKENKNMNTDEDIRKYLNTYTRFYWTNICKLFSNLFINVYNI